MKWSWLLAVGCVAVAVPLVASEVPQATATEKTTYLVTYRPGPAWIAGKPLTEQPLAAHFKYMLGLYTNGSMKLAGPFTDGSGGAVLLEVADEAAARSIVLADPAVRAGTFCYELRGWQLKPWEKYAKPTPEQSK